MKSEECCCPVSFLAYNFNFYHGGHGVSRRERQNSYKNSVFLRVLRG
jgi:hypothetical protein